MRSSGLLAAHLLSLVPVTAWNPIYISHILSPRYSF